MSARGRLAAATLVIGSILISCERQPPPESGSPAVNAEAPQFKRTILQWQPPGNEASIPRYEAQGLAVDGRLFVFGGFFNEKTQATLESEAYDPEENRWISLAPMPEKLTHAGQATDGKVIYLAGGFVGDHPGGSSNRLWRYHIARNEWGEGPPLPAPRGGGALVILNQRLHFFGGTVRRPGGKYEQDHEDHWILDLADPAAGWKTAAPLPNPRNHMGGCALDGKIYSVGGQHLGDEEAGNQSSFQVYDPGQDNWSELAPLPVSRGHVTANVVTFEGRILVISGVTNGRIQMDRVEEFDPATGKWSALAPLPEARQSPVSGIIGDRLIVSGGSLSRSTWIGQLSVGAPGD